MRLFAVLLTTLAVPVSTAQAGFRVNRSMDGVALGASESHVRAVRGAAAHKSLGPDFVTWRYRHPFLEVSFKRPYLGRFKLVTIGRAFHWMDRPATLGLLDALVEAGGAVALFGETYPDVAENAWFVLCRE